MIIRITTIAALSFALVSPVLADCREDLAKLEQQAVTAETGAATGKTGMPETQHQEEVLTDKQQGTSGEQTGTTAGQVETLTPHQKQVTGMSPDKSADVSQMLTDARKLAEAGDEEGCMRKVGELKDAMGIN
jgi:hypothetical protein